MSGIVGTGIQIDHATDTYLTDINIYGAPGNTTSQTLVVDTLAGGVQVENFSGGYAGLHGLVVRNAMPDHAAGGPTWLFFRNFVADCSAGGDGWLFDSSLGNAQLGATFLDSWAAGAGKNCTNNTVVTRECGGHTHIGWTRDPHWRRIEDPGQRGIGHRDRQRECRRHPY